MITSDVAVRIAKAHGLNLTDAFSLQRLAQTPEEAEALARTFVAPEQLTRDDLKSMSHTAILEAEKAGLLEDVLGRNPKIETDPTPEPTEPPAPTRPPEGLVSGSVNAEDRTSQLSREQLRHMTPAQINAAHAEGRLSDLLEGRKS